VAQGDPRLLRQVLDNLLSNAWKFSAHQTEGEITMGVEPDAEGKPVFFVRDNGAGFDMAHAGKLFGAFQRLHSVTDFPGTGIGLATVQRIIKRHGGRIWADSAPGRGATFYFTLGREEPLPLD
jgi:signal transduction histidine kinase